MATGSASKVARWRRCRHSAYYSDILKIQRITKSIAPVRGNILHDCLEHYYTGKDWTEPIKNLKLDLDKVFDEEREQWAKLPQELYRIMRGYILAFKGIDAGIKTLATEVHFKIPLGTHFYEGYIDWIYEDERGVWVADHKTVKILPKDTDLYMDAQTFMYYEAARTDEKLKKIIGDRPLAGVVFNHIRTKAPSEPKVLKSGGISKAACDTDIATYFDAVRKNGLNPEDYKDMIEKLQGNIFYKRTKIPISEKTISILKAEIITTLDDVDVYTTFGDTIEKTKFPRTMLKNRCDWDCEFRDLCYAELAGMSIQGIMSERYEPRSKREEADTDGE